LSLAGTPERLVPLDLLLVGQLFVNLCRFPRELYISLCQYCHENDGIILQCVLFAVSFVVNMQLLMLHYCLQRQSNEQSHLYLLLGVNPLMALPTGNASGSNLSVIGKERFILLPLLTTRSHFATLIPK
jgi:hypothetical protein